MFETVGGIIVLFFIYVVMNPNMKLEGLWERKKGVLTILALPPLLFYLAITTSPEYYMTSNILMVLIGIIILFILCGGLNSLMTDKEYKEYHKKQRDYKKAIDKLTAKQEKRERDKEKKKRKKRRK